VSAGHDELTEWQCANVSLLVTPAELEDFFGQYGSVVGHRIMRGYGFVEFSDREGVLQAVDMANGVEFHGETLRVEIARSRQRPRDRDRDYRDYRDRDPRDERRGYRAVITNMTPDTSWQVSSNIIPLSLCG
jgi:RNA recognition motif-containing protein